MLASSGNRLLARNLTKFLKLGPSSKKKEEARKYLSFLSPNEREAIINELGENDLWKVIGMDKKTIATAVKRQAPSLIGLRISLLTKDDLANLDSEGLMQRLVSY